MYRWVSAAGRFTATGSAATSWRISCIVSGVPKLTKLLDICAAHAGAQTLRTNRLTADIHALGSNDGRVVALLAVGSCPVRARQSGEHRRGS